MGDGGGNVTGRLGAGRDAGGGAAMALTPQRERMAEALAVERMHGDGVAAFVACRIAVLKAAGDSAGVERWVTVRATSPSGSSFGLWTRWFCGGTVGKRVMWPINLSSRPSDLASSMCGLAKFEQQVVNH